MICKKVCRKLCTIVLLLLLGVAPMAQATNGLELSGFGSVNRSLGGAGAATALDTAWTLVNPAGIALLERRFDTVFGMYAVERTLRPRGLSGNPFQRKMVDDSPVVGGDFGLALPQQGFHFATGLFTVGGQSVEYEASRSIFPKLRLQNWDRRMEQMDMRVPFVFAKDFGNGWLLGVSANFEYKRFRADHLVLNLGETEGGNRWDDAVGFGFVFGVQKHWEKFSLGAAYSTRHWMGKFKKYPDLTPRSLDSPQKIQVGLAWRFSPKWTGLLDYKWINWSGVQQLGNEIFDVGFGWQDQHLIKAGLMWEVNEKWALRFGCSHGNAPVDSNHSYVSALAPTTIETHLSVGLSRQLSRSGTLHLSVTRLVPNETVERGTQDLFAFLGRKTRIEAGGNAFGLAYTHRF